MKRLLVIALLSALPGTALNAADPLTKVIVPRDAVLPPSLLNRKLVDYKDFAIYLAPTGLVRSDRNPDGFEPLPAPGQLAFGPVPTDTITDTQPTLPGFVSRAPADDESALSLVQFAGPIKQEWLDRIAKLGAKPVQYVANYGYLVWANGAARRALSSDAAKDVLVEYSTLAAPAMKIDRGLRKAIGEGGAASALVDVTVQVYAHDGDETTRNRIERVATAQLRPWHAVLQYQNASFRVRISDLAEIASRGDVVGIARLLERRKYDEVQAQIVRGALNATATGPSGIGYLPWLQGLGFPTTPASYPITAVVDSSTGAVSNVDPPGPVDVDDVTLRAQGLAANPSRVVARFNCTTSAPLQIDGHGHINSSIAFGYDLRSNAAVAGARYPLTSATDGYQRGLGINPFGRLSSVVIFAPNYSAGGCGGSDVGVIQKTHDQGAVISTNSWGASVDGEYDDSAQAYDVGTRDAAPATAGNQQMIHLFAAGNDGSGASTIGSPGSGKNMITVGASENFRPEEGGNPWTDGCNTGPSGGDNAMDVIGFSSRGPAAGGRTKPEIIAPGTHITGTKRSFTNGAGVCDASRPTGNSTFSASSGTSHSTPAMAGAASLAYRWIANGPANMSFHSGSASAPTPSLMKAYLMAHTRYLTGESANDVLPSFSQGLGMPQLQLMFDSTSKYVVNESIRFDATGDAFTIALAAADPTKPIRIALAYTDAPGTINSANPAVNNLNLTVERAGQSFRGNVFGAGGLSVPGGSADAANNFEAVFLPASADAIRIRVAAFNVSGDGVPNVGDTTDQDFSLVCYNCASSNGFALFPGAPRRDVCVPTAAAFPIEAAAIGSQSGNVTLAQSGLNPPLGVSFSSNPVALGASSTLSISTTGATQGLYRFSLSGTLASATRSVPLELRVNAAVPAPMSATTPADAATNVPIKPTLAWDLRHFIDRYELQVSTVNTFATTVFSGSTDQTWAVVPGLNPSTLYFWRVRAVNSCGNSNYSATRSFTTASAPLEFCRTLALAIPDDNPTGVSDTLLIPTSGRLADVDVSVAVTHSYVNDLSFQVAGPGGQRISLFNSSCPTNGGADNINATFDDQAAQAITCAATSPAIIGVMRPLGALAALNGRAQNGSWQFTIQDSALEDEGTLTRWCVRPAFFGDLIWKNNFAD